MFYSVGQTAPQLEGTAYIADGARIIGGVHLGAEANIWYNAVLRADNAPILVGRIVSVLHEPVGVPLGSGGPPAAGLSGGASAAGGAYRGAVLTGDVYSGVQSHITVGGGILESFIAVILYYLSLHRHTEGGGGFFRGSLCRSGFLRRIRLVRHVLIYLPRGSRIGAFG